MKCPRSHVSVGETISPSLCCITYHAWPTMMLGHDLIPITTDLALCTLSESAKPHYDNDDDTDDDENA